MFKSLRMLQQCCMILDQMKTISLYLRSEQIDKWELDHSMLLTTLAWMAKFIFAKEFKNHIGT